VGTVLRAGKSYAERVTLDREPVVLEHIDEGHAALSVPAQIKSRSGRCVIAPLGETATGKGLGALIVVYPKNSSGTAELNLDYVVGFAGQVGVALQLAVAQRDREKIAVLEDRERIARDLHDLVIQRLFAAGMTLQSTEPLIADETAKTRLAAVADNLDGTIRELRQAIYQLQTPVITDDFRREVQQTVEHAVAGSEVKARTRFVGPAGSLIPDRIRPQVLAVVSEALSNAVRHACAATIDVTVGIGDGTVSVVVDDDGSGIDPAITRRSGLKNLDARARALGGALEIVTGSRGVGTRLVWAVPT
jgi:signal transduction histidine kinase